MQLQLKCRQNSSHIRRTLRGWNTFNRELENYLASIRGTSGIPLVYVIRKPHNPTDPVPTNATQRLIWEAPLYGGDYELDRQTVYRIIRAATSDTDGWAWINDIKDENGRQAMMNLWSHYDGPAAKSRQVQDAKE